MSTTKPTIVVVPGAWHSEPHFTTLLSHLQTAQFETICSRLPSVGGINPLDVTASTDADFIHEKMLLPLLNDGKDVLLVLHSYGGLPGNVAAKGLSKTERAAQGKKGGIIGLVIMCGLIAREGDSLQEMVGGKLHDWVDIDERSGTTTVPTFAQIFYQDLPAPLAASMGAKLLPHSVSAFRTPGGPPAWSDAVYDGRRGYIMAMEDASIVRVAQQMMVLNSGVVWDVKEAGCGHSPMLAMPGEVAGWIEGWAEEWKGKE